ncbi:hypothetical protein ACPV5W_00500 [Vibrio astriarenae]
MKTLIAFIFLLSTSVSVYAGYGSGRGGVPSVPCYINGEYEGTIAITECKRRGGKVPGEENRKGKTI